MSHLVVRSDETVRIPISEIGVLIVDNTGCSFTCSLLVELIKNKIKVIFCDEKHNPCCETIPNVGSHDCSKSIRSQIAWSKVVCATVWTELVFWKIKKQRDHLSERGSPQAALLDLYLNEIEYGDATNREGHAAKVYFNALWGMDFSRDKECPTNAALNYGYALLLSLFNKEIVSAGYLTQLGIWHDNQFNPYNLTSDLMEPFRPLIDRKVYDLAPKEFGPKEKREMLTIIEQQVLMDGQKQYLPNAIRIYVKSILDKLNGPADSLISMYSDLSCIVS
jgi:CRISPR-associated endonuclease Cas1 subtype II